MTINTRSIDPAARARCGVPRLNGQPCRAHPAAGGRECRAHEGLGGDPAPECAALVDSARRVATRTAASSPIGKAARRLVRILATAPSADAARSSARGIFEDDIRGAACRLLERIERDVAAWSARDIDLLVRIAWLDLRVLPEDGREDQAAEIFAKLRADVAAIADETGAAIREAQERAAAAEESAERQITRALRQKQAHAEAVARDFAGMGIADLSQGIDPHGFYV